MLFAGVWEEPQGGGHGGRLCPAEPGAAGLLLSLDGKVTDQNNPKKPTTAVSGCWPTPDGCPPRPRAAPPSSSSPTPGGPWWPSCGCCCRRGRCPSGRAQGAGGGWGAVLPPQDSAAVQVKMSNLLTYGSVFAVQVYPKQRNVQEEPPITNNNWEKEIEVGS